MGMSASQVRFLQLTERKSDIGRELQHLSLQKTDLTRDMQKVSRDYQSALSLKTLKWSNNSGITYTDISYGLLMNPGAANGNKPVLLSDSSGRIIVNDKYKKYAEMISESGSAGGNYSGATRDKILAELIGISDSQLAADTSTSSEVAAKQKALDDARKVRQGVRDKCQSWTPEQLIKNLNLTSGINAPINQTNFSSNAQSIKNAVKNYFSADVISEFEENLDAYADSFSDKYPQIDTVDEFVEMAIKLLKKAAGGGDKITVMADSNGNSLLSEYEAADAAYKAAETEYKSAVGVNAGVYTAEEEKQIAFYDDLFNAIVELGWKHDDCVEDSDYMSQMLQNNTYYITTMTKNYYYDESQQLSNSNYEYSFNVDCADNYDNIFKVNDADARSEALAKYEHEKSVINAKESRIDTRMKDLETEQSAIQKMLESIEQIKDDNIERTYGLWA